MKLSRVGGKKPGAEGRGLLDTFSTGRPAEDTSRRAPWKTRGRPTGGGWGGARRVFSWGLGAGVAVALLFALDLALTAGEIHAGVEVGSVGLGGRTAAEARELLEDGPARSVEEVVVVGPGDVRFTAGEMGVGLDVAATVERAYAVGREGSTLGRLAQRAGAALGGEGIPPEISYDPEAAGANAKELVSELLREEPEEATVTAVGGVVEVGESEAGSAVDLRATAEGVAEAALAGRGESDIVVSRLDPEVSTAEAEDAAARAERALSGPVTLTAEGEEWVLSPDEIGEALKFAPEGGRMEVSLDRERLRESLGGTYADLTVEPVEAGYTVRGDEVSVEEGRVGERVEDEELIETLETGLLEGRSRRFEIPVVTDEPELTNGEAEAGKPTALIGRYRTNYLTYDDGPGRVANLEIASDAVSGTTLAPGEVFSFNKLAEPLSYYETQVIINGQVDYSEGGGLCQVASTLYMAANYAGLKTVERHPHYAELPYIRPGFDATVWFGSLDLKFKNNTDGHLLLREWVDENGYVNAEIWGQPTGKEVEMNSELVSTSADAEGNPVTEWVTYRKVTRDDGDIVSDGPIHTDSYGYLKPFS